MEKTTPGSHRSYNDSGRFDIKSISKVAVIGAGLMGHGLGQIFACNGYKVALMDIVPGLLKAARESIRSNLNQMAEFGIIDKTEIESSIERIQTTTNLTQAVEGAGFVVEAVAERLEVKRNVFRQLDDLCPTNVILATNTSVISISEIAEAAKYRDRIVGTHFWNPPYLIPLVEVIRGNETDEAVMDATFDFMDKVGKTPVRVLKDVPGFVGNRLQHALWREAISVVEHGIADAATVDEVVKSSFGMRLPVLGPLENADLAGLDLTFQIHDYILKHIEASPAPSPLLKEKVEGGDLGFKTGRGLQEWTPEKIQGVRQKLSRHLLEFMAKSK